jgi:transposase
MNTLNYAALVALDWGDSEHAFALRVGEGLVETGSMPATSEVLHGWLEELGKRCGGKPVALAIEGGRSSVIHVLLAYPWIVVHPVHPATSERFRKAFAPSGAKADVPDAEVLLTILTQHRGQLRALRADTPETRKLSALNEVRRGAVQRRTQLSNELRSTLKNYYPQALELCGDYLWNPLALDFLLRWPELVLLKRARESSVRAFYTEHNCRRASLTEKRMDLIAASRPLTEDRAVIEPAILQVQMLVAVLRPMQAHIERVEEEIAAAFAAHPEAELYKALPGAGPSLAPRLLVAFGTRRERYPDAASLQKYAGVAPVKEQSGRQLWIHWRWNAPIFLRQTFVEWAGQTVPRCAWAKAYYLQQKRSGKRHHAILRALAFKWIRILWRCWQDRVPYDEARYIAALDTRKSPLAEALKAA